MIYRQTCWNWPYFLNILLTASPKYYMIRPSIHPQLTISFTIIQLDHMYLFMTTGHFYETEMVTNHTFTLPLRWGDLYVLMFYTGSRLAYAVTTLTLTWNGIYILMHVVMISWSSVIVMWKLLKYELQLSTSNHQSILLSVSIEQPIFSWSVWTDIHFTAWRWCTKSYLSKTLATKMLVCYSIVNIILLFYWSFFFDLELVSAGYYGAFRTWGVVVGFFL